MFRLIPAPLQVQNWLREGALALKKAGGATLDLLYPPACLACRRAVSEHGGLCPQCWSAMRFIERPFCERLGTPFAADFAAEAGGRTISPAAFADPPVFQRARVVARFEEGPARQLVHRLKYGDRDELAGPMGLWMARAGAELLSDADLLVPIPLHWTRLARRRFNQAAALAAAIEKVSAVPVETELLLRVKPTPPQVGLTRRLRAQNIQGAFVVPEERRIEVEGCRIVLVDDVMTSGATLNAAARILLRAGAKRVDALVFACVVRES
ncbi:ComF family protein [Rhodoblastus acidophilus]|uniref:ComF family protein n=1 Tax=Candidatus Rhodoblastus alkanivorans TaxID=2954117 RepID=A0ABS9ZAK6_9HYPH|nr:ComF family protein [Candidatus Rhodoblastus alkanivorans]MCI4677768.1 ComF family protein [Candidatus Rhodoblastus alkanivorans]MCI4684734.1 ComF family protein [Candidatus Rhodoblastus alkanivorans]MDI4642056.1 ComF family protein [Rhodoblastus acidophilus]